MKVWKTLRWIFLASLILVLVLLLTKPKPPQPPTEAAQKPQLAADFEQKLENLERARAAGQSGAFESFSPEEVNAGLQTMIATADAEGVSSGPETVRNVAVSFVGDEVVGQASVQRLRKDIYVTVSGRLGAKDGYVTFEPTAFRIGNLSIPVSLVNPRLQQRLADPDVRERLRLPDFVGELRIRDGKLEITEK